MGKEIQENGKTKNQLQQENYQKMLDERSQRADYFKSIYGTTPKLFDKFPQKEKELIEGMTVELPQGLSEEDFMMTVMGAMSADERMHQVLTTSSNDGYVYRFNHVFMTENVTAPNGDERINGFEKVMVDARKKAIEAVEAFKNGDKSLVQQYHQKFLDGTKVLAEIPKVSEEVVNKTPDYVFELAGELLERPDFKERNQDATSINLYNVCKAQKIAVENVKRKQRMLDNIPPKGSKERENMLQDIILSGYIVGRNEIRRKKEYENHKVSVVNGLVGMGHNKMDLFVSSQGEPFAHYMSQKSMMSQVNSVDLILQEDNGYDKIKEMYGEDIKKTDLFTSLMNAEDETLGDSLESVGMMIGMTNARFEDFKNVPVSRELEEKAMQLSTPGLEANKKLLSEKMEELKEPSKEFLRHKKYEHQEVFAGAGQEDVKASMDQIGGLLNTLEEADPSWRKAFAGKQDKFAVVKESLKKLNQFTKNMSVEPGNMDINKFIQLSKEVEKAAEDYLEYKKTNHKDSNYEKNRIAAVDAVHDSLMYKRRSVAKWNLNSMERQAKKEKTVINSEIKMTIHNDERVAAARENAKKHIEINQRINETSAGYESVKKVFYDGDFNKIEGKSYSVTRSAVVSIATMALASTGKYSMEELADPSKLKEEKRKMGEEVVRHIEGATHDDQKWIAGNIIEGQKKMVGMVNDFCNKHDVLASDFGLKPEYVTMRFAQETLFDTFQELKHCLPEADEYLKEKYPDDPVQSAEQFRNEIQDKVRPIADITSGIQKVNQGIEKYITTGVLPENTIQAGMQVKIMRDALSEKRQQQPDKPLTELLKPAEAEAIALKSILAFSNAGKDLAYGLKSQVKTREGIPLVDTCIDKIADGSLFNDMKVDETGMKIENAPTVDKLKADFRFEGFKHDETSLNFARDGINNKISSLGKKVEKNKAAHQISRDCSDSSGRIEMMVKRSIHNIPIGDNSKTYVKQYFKERMALELCAKTPPAFENASKEQILKGVENFKGYQNLAARIDNMGIPEIMELWDSDVTQNIIDQTIAEQKGIQNADKSVNKNVNLSLNKDEMDKIPALKNDQLPQV